MSSRRALVAFAFLTLGLLGPGCRRVPLPPAEIGMWYWHTPFQVTDADRAELRRMGVSTLYVRAATFATDGKAVKPILPQKWNPVKDMSLVLTFNLDPGLVSHLEELSIPSMASDVSRSVERSIVQAEGEKLTVAGVQFDVDCPTRLLPRYTELLKEIRQRLRPGTRVSITLLPTWLGSKHMPALAKAVDFVVPQFYEGRTGRSVREVLPVSDPSAIRKGLKQLEKLGIPAHVGIASYGHAMLYSPEGELAGMYRALNPEDALRHPSFVPESSGPITDKGAPAERPEDSVGEDRLILRAVKPDLQGRGLGCRIAYLLPTPAMIGRQMSAFREERSSNVRGVILYRFPEPQESMSLPLAAVADALEGKPERVDAQIRVTSKVVPYTIIDTGKQVDRAPSELTVRLESTGNSPSLAARGAFELVLQLDRPGVEEVVPGDFDEVEVGVLAPTGDFTRCAGVRADTIRLRRHHLLPGDRLRSGTIRLAPDGASKVTARWHALGPGGFQKFRGELPPIPLGGSQ